MSKDFEQYITNIKSKFENVNEQRIKFLFNLRGSHNCDDYLNYNCNNCNNCYCCINCNDCNDCR